MTARARTRHRRPEGEPGSAVGATDLCGPGASPDGQGADGVGRVPERGCFAALGHRFTFASPEAPLRAHVGDLLAPLRAPGHTGTRYEHRVSAAGHILCRDGAPLRPAGPAGLVVPTLLWQVNRQAVASSAGIVPVHAAAAARGRAGVVLAGRSGAGKTTLVAGLVRAGLDYLTDEVVAIDPTTGRILAYPKPLSVKIGGRRLLEDLRRPTPAALTAYESLQWQLPATSIRADAPGDWAEPRVVVIVDREPGTACRLEPLRPGEAVLALAANLLRYGPHPRRDVEALATVVTRSRSFRLTVDGLDEACQALVDLIDQPLPGAA